MGKFGGKVIAFCLMGLLLASPLSAGGQQDQSTQPASDQVSPPHTQEPESNPTPSAPTQLPDSPGAVQAARPAVAAPPTGTQAPAGTAAAEVSNASGVAASRPAGVAIAPAKQRRVRSFLIKVGVIAGAGVAVGTVYALSQASPSRPPGAR